MRRLILKFTALLLLAAFASPVLACINDREVNRSEREFKSQYMTPTPTSEPSTPPSQDSWTPFALLGGGAVLLVGATVTTFKQTRRTTRNRDDQDA
jgi:hypothetical protein